MIVGLGIDLVEIARIRRAIDASSGPRFVERCFTAGERAYCDGRADRATHYAARFAAKEAASKALGVPRGIRFTDVEVTRDGDAPRLVLRGPAADAAARLGVRRTHLALTHDGGIAAATVVAEGDAP